MTSIFDADIERLIFKDASLFVINNVWNISLLDLLDNSFIFKSNFFLQFLMCCFSSHICVPHFEAYLKELFSQMLKVCHNLLTHMSFQTCTV